MLSGAYASEMVRGMQEGESYPRYLKIGAALKHFTACQYQHALPRGRPLVLPRGLSPLPLECVPPLPPGPPPPASTAHRALTGHSASSLARESPRGTNAIAAKRRSDSGEWQSLSPARGGLTLIRLLYLRACHVAPAALQTRRRPTACR